jgi:hypothetical protein
MVVLGVGVPEALTVPEVGVRVPTVLVPLVEELDDDWAKTGPTRIAATAAAKPRVRH